ncbi:E3 ubiquitin-protein ligase WAV3-like [Silene latifolia]|uniref:E3 ubiquitin-protein ligase WAV3-like n=1 Tax=Silene latifolia TaxID=37657 RepID=UPI003D773527
MHYSMEICKICNRCMNTGALFTAECSHKFHYNCIYYNLQNGSHICPTCYPTCTQVPPQAPPPLFNTPTNHPFFNHPVVYPSFNFSAVRPIDANLGNVNFNDDDPLSSSEAPLPPQQGSPMPMTVKAVPEYPALSKSDQSDSFAVLASIKAPSLSSVDMANSRAPLDLVAVLDVSGSMGGQKIILLKQAVNFVIKNLGPTDRLSIITFSSNSKRLTPLTRMTQAGQADTLRVVGSIKEGGSTNIIAGLQTAVKVLEQRREKNPVTSIILLSDGQDNYNHNFMSCLNQLPQSIRSNATGSDLNPTASDKFPVHTFGFGSDHDASALHAISDGSGGTFSYIEAIEVIQDAFAQCLGGLLSVVAQQVEIQVHSGCPEVRIKSIASGRYKNTIDSFGSQHGVVYVGDIYADEEKQFLVYLSVPKAEEKEGETSTTKLLEVKCSYKNPLSDEKIESNTARAEIRRPLKEELSEEDKQVCLEVDREKNRISIAEGIAEAQKMAERGELFGARSLLECKRLKVKQSYAGNVGDGPTMSFFGQAGMVAQCMSSTEAYVGGGRAYGLSAQSSHQYQRANAQMFQQQSMYVGAAPSCAAPGGFGFGGFQTSAMEQMVKKSQQERQGSGQNQATDGNTSENPFKMFGK